MKAPPLPVTSEYRQREFLLAASTQVFFKRGTTIQVYHLAVVAVAGARAFHRSSWHSSQIYHRWWVEFKCHSLVALLSNKSLNRNSCGSFASNFIRKHSGRVLHQVLKTRLKNFTNRQDKVLRELVSLFSRDACSPGPSSVTYR